MLKLMMSGNLHQYFDDKFDIFDDLNLMPILFKFYNYKIVISKYNTPKKSDKIY